MNNCWIKYEQTYIICPKIKKFREDEETEEDEVEEEVEEEVEDKVEDEIEDKTLSRTMENKNRKSGCIIWPFWSTFR